MNLEGLRLGEFEILTRLGQGGMGAVYKARQTSLKRLVALKTLQAEIAGDAEYIARFEREAVAAASLSHPNLVQVYSAGTTDGLHWFAMEYVEGGSAGTLLKRKGRLDPTEAIDIALHVATALEYGWRKAALIHRDVKPENIFLSTDGEVKLGDLGLARSGTQSQGLTLTGTSMGSPHYISPEQAEALKTVDLRTDIYSLGCTLYHFLCGKPPYEGDSVVSIIMKHVKAPVPDVRREWPDCPRELSATVAKMMQKSPSRRQQSHSEVITGLRRARETLHPSASYGDASVTPRASERLSASVEKLTAFFQSRQWIPGKATLEFLGQIAFLAGLALLAWLLPWKKGADWIAKKAHPTPAFVLVPSLKLSTPKPLRIGDLPLLGTPSPETEKFLRLFASPTPAPSPTPVPTPVATPLGATPPFIPTRVPPRFGSTPTPSPTSSPGRKWISPLDSDFGFPLLGTVLTPTPTLKPPIRFGSVSTPLPSTPKPSPTRSPIPTLSPNPMPGLGWKGFLVSPTPASTPTPTR